MCITKNVDDKTLALAVKREARAAERKRVDVLASETAQKFLAGILQRNREVFQEVLMANLPKMKSAFREETKFDMLNMILPSGERFGDLKPSDLDQVNLTMDQIATTLVDLPSVSKADPAASALSPASTTVDEAIRRSGDYMIRANARLPKTKGATSR